MDLLWILEYINNFLTQLIFQTQTPSLVEWNLRIFLYLCHYCTQSQQRTLDGRWNRRDAHQYHCLYRWWCLMSQDPLGLCLGIFWGSIIWWCWKHIMSSNHVIHLVNSLSGKPWLPFWLRMQNIEISALTHIDGGIPCLSGQTKAYQMLISLKPVPVMNNSSNPLLVIAESLLALPSVAKGKWGAKMKCWNVLVLSWWVESVLKLNDSSHILFWKRIPSILLGQLPVHLLV